jgi:hypothetical protein
MLGFILRLLRWSGKLRLGPYDALDVFQAIAILLSAPDPIV